MEEAEEEEEAEEAEEKEEEGKADIKSNNPHLTGGEKKSNWGEKKPDFIGAP